MRLLGREKMSNATVYWLLVLERIFEDGHDA